MIKMVMIEMVDPVKQGLIDGRKDAMDDFKMQLRLASTGSDASQVSGSVASVCWIPLTAFRQKFHVVLKSASVALDTLQQPSVQQKGFVGSSSEE